MHWRAECMPDSWRPSSHILLPVTRCGSRKERRESDDDVIEGAREVNMGPWMKTQEIHALSRLSQELLAVHFCSSPLLPSLLKSVEIMMEKEDGYQFVASTDSSEPATER